MRHLLISAGLALAGLAAGLSVARAEPPVTTFTLDNGMDVVVIEDHRAPTVTHMVWYRVGAADEPWGKSGIAHFFEHLMFKGTDDLEPGEFSRIVAENGGSGNAFTSYDYTAYFQRIAADRLGLMMELEAERMRDLILDDESVATERDVILEERNQRTDNDPQALFGEQLRNVAFQNHPYKVPVIGWRHEIENLSTADATAFYERYYAPDNAILVVAGDVTPEDVRTLADQHYGPLEPSGNPPDARPVEPPQRAPRRLVMTDPDVRQPVLQRIYYAPAYDRDNPDEAATLNLLASSLGDGITSSLGKRLQIEQGIAIVTGAAYDPATRDPIGIGLWAIPAEGVSLETLEAAVDEVIEDFKANGPDPELLARIQRNALANEIYAQDDQAGMARRYGRSLAVGLTVEDVQGWSARIAAVTPEAIQQAAQKWLVPEGAATGWLMRETEPVAEPETAAEKEAG